MNPISHNMSVWIKYDLMSYYRGLGYNTNESEKFAKLQIARLDVMPEEVNP